MSEYDDLVSYFKNVLGVSAVLSTSKDANLAATSAQHRAMRKLTFVIENLAGYSALETDLLNKMIAAMKLDADSFQIVDLVDIAAISSDAGQDYIYLVDQPGSGQTYSPRQLIKNPKLKKQAWDFLQTKMN